MFSGIVAVICPTGLSHTKRQIFSKGLASHAATVLDFPPGDGHGASSSTLMASTSKLFGGGPAKSPSSKRKRSGSLDGSSGSSKKSKKRAADSPTPTLVVCDAASFSSARTHEDMEEIFSAFPLKDEASSVKVVRSEWLSECLRVGSRQPFGSHLLDTVTLATVSNFATRNAAAASAAARSGARGATPAPASSSGSWGCLARSPPPKAPATPSARPSSTGKDQPKQQSTWGPGSSSSSSNTSAGRVGVGAGPGGAHGPGTLPKEPVWRDSDSDSGSGGGGGGGGGGGKDGRWEELVGGSVLRWVPSTARVSTHIVAFDMDGTLIKTKSGKKFGDAADDWQFWHGKIPAVLRKWHERGYKVAIISNQMGIGTGKADKQTQQAKVRSIVRAIGVPVEAYLACQDDYYRKPRLGCWDLVSTSCNGGLKAEKEACLYVGDAAGRPKQGTYKKDFSAGDLKLALNAGIPFQTPEQFFMGSTQPLHKNRSLAVLGFDPSSLVGKTPAAVETLTRDGGGLEVVVLVGPPAGGKSTLCKDRLPGYARVNQDELKTLNKCRQVATARLKDGMSVVIDATNPKRNTRADWVVLARQHGATARCIFLTTPKEVCFHLNVFRGCNPCSTEEERRKVPDVVIHTWFKYLELPQSSEGFSEVIRVPFAMRDFGEKGEDSFQREFMLMHLVPNTTTLLAASALRIVTADTVAAAAGAATYFEVYLKAPLQKKPASVVAAPAAAAAVSTVTVLEALAANRVVVLRWMKSMAYGRLRGTQQQQQQGAPQAYSPTAYGSHGPLSRDQHPRTLNAGELLQPSGDQVPQRAKKRGHAVVSRETTTRGGRTDKKAKQTEISESDRFEREPMAPPVKPEAPTTKCKSISSVFPDKAYAPHLVKFAKSIFNASIAACVDDDNDKYIVQIAGGGGNKAVAAKVAKLLQHADQVSREGEPKPIGFTLTFVGEAKDTCGAGWSTLPSSKELQHICATFGVAAVHVRPQELKRSPDAKADHHQHRPPGGRPRYLGSSARARARDGVLLWGLDPCVSAAQRWVQAAVAGCSHEVALPLGPFITGRLDQADFARVIKNSGKRFFRAKAFVKQPGTVCVRGAMDPKLFGQLMVIVIRYLQKTVANNVTYVKVGDSAIMRQLVATGELSRLTHELGVGEQFRTIPLWECQGVLIFAPDERAESSDSDDEEEEVTLEFMREAVSATVWHWKQTRFTLPLSAARVKVLKKHLETGSNSNNLKFIRDLCGQIEGLDCLWLDGIVVRGRVSVGQRKAIVLERLCKEIKEKRNTRAHWVALARQHGATARSVLSLERFPGMQPVLYGERASKGPGRGVIHTWFKYLELPQASEGFSEAIRVPFAMRDFGEKGEDSFQRETVDLRS
eukprot:g2097.t1